MIKTLPITEVREKLPTLVSNAQKKLDEYIITVNGKPAATIISHDEYESLKETLEILSNNKLMKEIREAEKDIDAGNYITLEELEKKLKKNV